MAFSAELVIQLTLPESLRPMVGSRELQKQMHTVIHLNCKCTSESCMYMCASIHVCMKIKHTSVVVS